MKRRIVFFRGMLLVALAVLVLGLTLPLGCKDSPSATTKDSPLITTTEVIPGPEDKGTIVSASLPAFTIDDCIKHSDAIVIAKVAEILPAKWGKNPMGEIIYQDVIVQTERYLYGEPESEFIAVLVWGGKVGNTYMITADSEAMFTVGEQTFLFLHRPPKEYIATVPEGIDPRSYYRVTASIIGKYKLKNDTITDWRGNKFAVSEVEQKIASIRGGK